MAKATAKATAKNDAVLCATFRVRCCMGKHELSGWTDEATWNVQQSHSLEMLQIGKRLGKRYKIEKTTIVAQDVAQMLHKILHKMLHKRLQHFSGSYLWALARPITSGRKWNEQYILDVVLLCISRSFNISGVCVSPRWVYQMWSEMGELGTSGAKSFLITKRLQNRCWLNMEDKMLIPQSCKRINVSSSTFDQNRFLNLLENQDDSTSLAPRSPWVVFLSHVKFRELTPS